MRIIKLNATHSTNDYLRDLVLYESCEDFTVVVAKTQTNGKGQLHNNWSSQSGKNLTFSVFKANLNLNTQRVFVVSMVTALAVHKTLKDLGFKRTFVKWPNDILTDKKKVCGILVENTLKVNVLKHSIIGIGLNVNQLIFDALPNATSLKKLSGINFNLDEQLLTVLGNLEYYFKKLTELGDAFILETYNNVLFRKQKPSMFEVEGDLIVGKILNVSLSGKLNVLFEDDVIKSFNLKEIKQIY